MGGRELTPFAGTLSTIWGLEGSQGLCGSPRGCWTYLTTASLSSIVPARWAPVAQVLAGAGAALMCLAGRALSLDASPAGGPAGASGPLWG